MSYASCMHERPCRNTQIAYHASYDLLTGVGFLVALQGVVDLYIYAHHSHATTVHVPRSEECTQDFALICTFKTDNMCTHYAGALLWLAPPCGSWVFMARGSTGRSRSRVRGSRKFESVKAANRLCRRILYLAAYARKKGVDFCLEQPYSSLMPLYAPLQRLLRRTGASSISVPLGEYGAKCEPLAFIKSRTCMHADREIN